MKHTISFDREDLGLAKTESLEYALDSLVKSGYMGVKEQPEKVGVLHSVLGGVEITTSSFIIKISSVKIKGLENGKN